MGVKSSLSIDFENMTEDEIEDFQKRKSSVDKLTILFMLVSGFIILGFGIDYYFQKDITYEYFATAISNRTVYRTHCVPKRGTDSCYSYYYYYCDYIYNNTKTQVCETLVDKTTNYMLPDQIFNKTCPFNSKRTIYINHDKCFYTHPNDSKDISLLCINFIYFNINNYQLL